MSTTISKSESTEYTSTRNSRALGIASDMVSTRDPIAKKGIQTRVKKLNGITVKRPEKVTPGVGSEVPN